MIYIFRCRRHDGDDGDDSIDVAATQWRQLLLYVYVCVSVCARACTGSDAFSGATFYFVLSAWPIYSIKHAVLCTIFHVDAVAVVIARSGSQQPVAAVAAIHDEKSIGAYVCVLQ